MEKEVLIYSDPINDITRMSKNESNRRIAHNTNYEVLKSNIIEFYNDIANIFENLENKCNDFQLDEIVINAEIGINGKVGFMGTGIEGSAKSGISFKLKRK